MIKQRRRCVLDDKTKWATVFLKILFVPTDSIILLTKYIFWQNKIFLIPKPSKRLEHLIDVAILVNGFGIWISAVCVAFDVLVMSAMSNSTRTRACTCSRKFNTIHVFNQVIYILMPSGH